MLGTYTFSGSGSEYIELSDLGDKTAADAIRLVEITTAPPPTLTANLYYSHNDHLGTPQVFTDQNQNVVWQADYQPFGEVSETINIFANNLRFAGQYFDEESNLHYNYFRDYDPSTGRYIESDPIGLAGGLNTYAYVGGNPLIYSDPFGLFLLPSDKTPAGIALMNEISGVANTIGAGVVTNTANNVIDLAEERQKRDDSRNNDKEEECPPNGLCNLEFEIKIREIPWNDPKHDGLSIPGLTERQCHYYCPKTGRRFSKRLTNRLGCPSPIPG